MKKNLQEAEYREIKGLDIRGQLLENAGTPEDRGDGKPFLMHKLKVMIGPYQKDIPITNQELRKIMFIQENKEMTLKEMIKEELEKILKEGMAGSAPELDRVPSDKALAIGAKHAEMEKQAKELLRALDDPDEPVSKSLLKQLLNQVLKGLADGADYSPSLQGMGEGEGKGHLGAPIGSRHRAKQMYRRGYEDGLRGQMPRNLDDRKDKHYRAGQKDGEEERDAGRGYD